MVLPKPKPKLPRRTLDAVKQQGTWNITSRISFATNRLWYGVYSLVPQQLRWLVPFVQEDIKEFFRSEPEIEEEIGTSPSKPKISEEISDFSLPIYEKYRCSIGNPLNCQQPQQTIAQEPQAKSCDKCGFPALLPNLAEVQGNHNRYRIIRYLGSRGWGRLYAAIQVVEEQPVIIKEYLLPRKHFNEKESILAQKTFENVGGLELADGRSQNARIVPVIEAIADRHDTERCYLITKQNIDSYATLRTYLAQNQAMSSRELRHLLNQVLQSLEYLHGSKFRLPNGQIQTGIAHGNINLDSLLISPLSQNYFHTPQFFVYLCDLGLWENLFNPPPYAPFHPTAIKDLEALGYVSFYLLAGRSYDQKGSLLDPKVTQNWAKVDIALKFFIYRLLGIDTPFNSATEARRTLLNLPTEEELIASGLETIEPNTSTEIAAAKQRWLWWLLILLALSLLGTAIGWWLLSRQTLMGNNRDITLCCIKDVPAVPDGQFTYTAEKNGIWNYILRQPNLIEKDKTLEAKIIEQRPKLTLNFLPKPTGEEAIAEVKQEQADFAISSLIDNLNYELDTETFAYDGLVFFVAFSYEQRDRALPEKLNGQITFKQIQQLYTGKITNWKQLGGPDLPVKLYIPTSQEAIRIFEQRVLKDEAKIEEFRKLQESQNNPTDFVNSSPQIIKSPTLKTLRTVLQDFENQEIGAIGFGTISQVFGQCSVYPLAIVDLQNKPIQPLIQDNGQPINPATDLCNKKGNYHPDLQAFQTGRYPLAYPIAVVYPRDNRRLSIGERFANILKTEESQNLLSKTGVVPIQPPAKEPTTGN